MTVEVTYNIRKDVDCGYVNSSGHITVDNIRVGASDMNELVTVGRAQFAGGYFFYFGDITVYMSDQMAYDLNQQLDHEVQDQLREGDGLNAEEG